MITGSHNPPEFNGFKICIGNDTIYGENIQKLRKIMEIGQYVTGNASSSFQDITAAYQNYLFDNVQITRKIKVAVDAGNGVGGKFALPILQRYGCEVIPIYCEPDGNFPSGVWLPTVDWDVLLSKPGFSNTTVLAAIVNPVVGATTNVGLLRMAPIDSNGNGIADSWETIYFAGVSNVNPLADADSDGQNNRNEYLAGTNPTNAASVFKASQFTATNGFTLRWPVVSGRSYRVLTTSSLVPGIWTPAAGPWTATGSTNMSWTDVTSATNMMYQIQATAP